MSGEGFFSPCGGEPDRAEPTRSDNESVKPADDGVAAAPSLVSVTRPTGCRDVRDFEIIAKIGEGTYGVVSRARDPRSGALVALKQIKFTEVFNDFPLPTLREIRALRRLQHPNVVRLREIATAKSDPADRAPGGHVFMVLSYSDHDLAGLLRISRSPSSGYVMTPERIRSYTYQLLRGLAYCHSQGWVHRDIKTANLLITSQNELSITDFGLAKRVEPGRHATPNVVTLWYRAPEVLYQDPSASFPLDVWSAGCVFGEILSGRELFCGHDSLSQITMIYKLCGADLTGWPGVQQLKPFQLLRPKTAYTPQFRTRFPRIGPLELDLLTRLLCINPHKRITAEAALQHPYFTQGGLPPPDPSTLPAITVESAHEMEVIAASRATAASGRAIAGAPLQRAGSAAKDTASALAEEGGAPVAGQKRGRPSDSGLKAFDSDASPDGTLRAVNSSSGQAATVPGSALPPPVAAPASVQSVVGAALARLKAGAARSRLPSSSVVPSSALVPRIAAVDAQPASVGGLAPDYVPRRAVSESRADSGLAASAVRAAVTVDDDNDDEGSSTLFV